MQPEERRLLVPSEGEDVEGPEPAIKHRTSGVTKYAPSYRSLWVLVVLQSALLLACFTAIAILLRRDHGSHCSSRVLYSPALDAVEPQIKVFNVGFEGDLSPYQIPSSPELDRAWDDLYQFGISRITKEEATQLPNKTQPIPGDEDHYIAELDVFHNLHCLNMVRKALDPVYYSNWNITENAKAAQHVSHCVDWIRQSIMCHADTSVIVWQWEDWANETLVRGKVAHTCRNFEKIQDWAKEHQILDKFDGSVHLTDDITIPVLQSGDL
ncbi:hypothetical protein VNI00_000166 [Paramarasmius palmivorus]|uniref:Tat pathway signal sequence n=1 Tax=Paramarasmius palmivorus TaxID=297713 RepID=A0AAW0EGT2_9AGAR